MKKLEEFELKKLREILKLTKEELERNDKIYYKLLQNTEDEQTIYEMTKRYDNKMRNLEKALKTPYFARVDFTEEDSDNTQYIYIGRTNIFDEESNVAVVDWRAPISSIYYDGQIGKTQYKCPEGVIKGQLSLKRQYTIENAELLSYNDIDITTNDQVLQDCLNENSDTRLKNIVATIQSEQNKIIRANMFKPLIVQGVAGSGKTTVALHRIAYLVYTYENSFRPEDFLIIAPNKFFLDYISNVLPDLGVDYVRQQTFEEFALEIIDAKINLENQNIKLSKIVNGCNKINLLQDASKFKSSIRFKEMIDEYLYNLKDSILPKLDFKISGITVISFTELKQILDDNFTRNSLKHSLDIMHNIMDKRVKDRANDLVEIITKKRKEDLEQIDTNLDLQEQQQKRLEIFKQTEYEIGQLLKGGKRLVSDYIKQIKLEKIIEHYKKIIKNKELFNKFVDEELSKYIIEQFNPKKLEYEDITPLLYLQYKIFGLSEKFSLKHIVIDEAQDFSEFQFFTLNKILQNNKSITILGDIAQGIYSYKGTNDWDRINKIVFNGEANIEKLNNSYRTTYEIMTEANKILDKIRRKENINLAIPVSRHGEKVNYFKTENKIELIESSIEELINKGYKNIAIIGKNTEECNDIYKEIRKFKAKLILEYLNDYSGGITIVPSYLSKGLEFDSVIIYDINSYNNTDLETKLLYVAFTRAMHTLDVFS